MHTHHTAGLLSNHKCAETSLAEWHRVFRVNVDGALLLSQQVLPGMVRSGGFGWGLGRWGWDWWRVWMVGWGWVVPTARDGWMAWVCGALTPLFSTPFNAPEIDALRPHRQHHEHGGQDGRRDGGHGLRGQQGRNKQPHLQHRAVRRGFVRLCLCSKDGKDVVVVVGVRRSLSR